MLAISALLRPPPGVPASRWLWLPLLTGLAVADGIRAATEQRSRGLVDEAVGDAFVVAQGRDGAARGALADL